MKRVRLKQRHALAVAALIYSRAGSYVETYRRVGDAFRPRKSNPLYHTGYEVWGPYLSMRSILMSWEPYLSERYIRINLKRMGIGFNPRGRMYTRGETMKIGEDGWVMTRLVAQVYKRERAGKSGLETFISHHHPNGAAYEVRVGEDACLGCGARIPKQVLMWKTLKRLGD